MKVTGLIVEYNPFHNGHLYHLEQSRKVSDADYVIGIMSGNFIQRGEPAIVNKWARTRMAILSGIDLLIELPVVYAMSSAEYFAYGAISILDNLGIVDHVCFGSESGNIDELALIAETLIKEPEDFKKLLKSNLKNGLSFPSAREAALSEYFTNCSVEKHTGSIISSPNNILGIEYLKALKRLNSCIVPLTIKRTGNEYNSEKLSGCISSATAIRKSILNYSDKYMASSIAEALPPVSQSILQEEFDSGRGPVFSEAFETILLSYLRKIPSEEIRLLPFVSEGIENRIIEAAEASGSLDELIWKISTKRYTRTRIQRILFSMLTGLTSSELESFIKLGPQYIRVLGFNGKGRKLISDINKKACLPVIVKAADFKKSCNPLLKRMLEIEAQATDIYVLGYKNPEFRKGGQEFTQNIAYIKG